jgi:hypothetical protein
MAGTIKPRHGTRRHAVALLALAALLPSAPVAWALGKVSQKPGTAGCISETGTGGACQHGTALNGAAAYLPTPPPWSLTAPASVGGS